MATLIQKSNRNRSKNGSNGKASIFTRRPLREKLWATAQKKEKEFIELCKGLNIDPYPMISRIVFHSCLSAFKNLSQIFESSKGQFLASLDQDKYNQNLAVLNQQLITLRQYCQFSQTQLTIRI